MVMKQSGKLPPRFWAKVQESGEGCWEWTASKSAGGYGKFSRPGHGNGWDYAHRVAYVALVGEVGEGLDLDHLCRVRHCVNPEHLEPVTRKENLRRGVGPTGINANKTHCIRGHEFTEENTFREPGGRRCRECTRAKDRARRARC